MLKDEKLNWLAERRANVASFVSFGTDGNQRYSWIRGTSPDYRFQSIAQATEAILAAQDSSKPTLNIRTFLPDKPDGNPFEYGLSDPRVIQEKVLAYAVQNFHIILNETVDVKDGGFSGVLFGDLMEGAPGETPRCVEKPGCMCLPREIGFALIKQVYGFHFHVPFTRYSRVEFSIHPHRVGYWRDFSIIWQEEEYLDQPLPVAPSIQWPNKFSRGFGDKAFGQLVAHLLGMPVPYTEVNGRMVKKCEFGTPIYSGEPDWYRTAPFEQSPGQFTTKRGHLDMFKVMHEEDPDGVKIAAMLRQHGIRAEFSGSAITDNDGRLIVEGCRGYGAKFMVGMQASEDLPEVVKRGVAFLSERLQSRFGDVRFEWVFDGERAWCVQLHLGKVETLEDIIYPGKPKRWLRFEIQGERALEDLRTLVTANTGKKIGIILEGDVGITSHFGDILRKAKIPSRRKQPNKKP